MAFYTYILASRPYGTLYTGSTESITQRVHEHREGLRQGFTKKYGVHRLVWFEPFSSRDEAFKRERRIKQWNRAWKIRIIEELNPYWEDLYAEFVDCPDQLLGSPPPRG